MPFLAHKRDTTGCGAAGLLFWHGHVQRGSHLALRMPARFRGDADAGRSACAFFSLRLSRIISSIDGLGAEEAEYRHAHGLVTGCGRVMGIIRLAAQRIVHWFSLADAGKYG